MQKTKNRVGMALIIAVCSLILISCSDEEGIKIAYGKEIYGPLMVELDRTADPDRKFAELIRSYEDASAILPDRGVPSATVILYDEKYFEENDLLIAGFMTNTVFEHSVDRLILHENTLTLYMNEYVPRGYTQLATYRAILVDIPKGSVPEDVSIDVRFQQILAK